MLKPLLIAWDQWNAKQHVTFERADEMSTVLRGEFEARIEAIEARMDARIATMGARLDAYVIRAEERDKRLDERLEERDKRLEERDKRLDERDKRIELIAQQVAAAAKSASNLKAHMWLATTTIVIAVSGTVVAAYYAAQSSHLGITQAVISAFQQGQQTQNPLREQGSGG
jgi:hypothetical protein